MRCSTLLKDLASMTKCLPLVFLFILETTASDSEESLQSSDVLYPSYTRNDLFSDLDDSSSEFWKRAPGWGKRALELEQLTEDELEEDKRAPGWGKRAPGWGKRAPGWGKRAPGWGKRAPGWGKRAPGWGKRAPGWGKRAPGWGKRAPGWGKRAPGWGKRAPGWGKRAPGWGKRAPGWGKRSDDIDVSSFDCTSLQQTTEELRTWTAALESRLAQCEKSDQVMSSSQTNEL